MIAFLHASRFCASFGSRWCSFISLRILSIHLSLGLPRGLFPHTFIVVISFTTLLSSIIVTWPFHERRFLVKYVVIGLAMASLLNFSVLTLSVRILPWSCLLSYIHMYIYTISPSQFNLIYTCLLMTLATQNNSTHVIVDTNKLTDAAKPNAEFASTISSNKWRTVAINALDDKASSHRRHAIQLQLTDRSAVQTSTSALDIRDI